MANPRLDLTELGATGLRRTSTSVYDEFLVQLRAPNGWRLYREMADNDPVIGSILYAIEKVIVRLDWRVEPYSAPSEDGGPTDDDQEIADFVESCLYDMSESWDSTLSSLLSMLTFGWSYHEIVYKKRVGPEEKDPKKRSKFDDGRIGWRKWPIRSQESWLRWEFDEDGGVQSMTQFDPAGGGTMTVPIDKALLFRTVAVKNNPEGRSLLRNAYRPYFFKKRIEEIEAIGIERDLAGLPVAYVPPEYLSSGATAEQKIVLQEIAKIVQNIKRNEQEGVIFPAAYDESGHKIFELQLLSSGGSRQFDTDKIISRYDQRIAMSVLSDFILLGHERVGSFALGTAKMDLWSMAVDAIARNIAETINQHAIPRLLRLNGMDASRAPQLNYGDVAAIDLTEIADFVSKLTAAGVLVSDPNLEDYLRELGGLPPAEHNAFSTGAVMPPNGEEMMGQPQMGQPQMQGQMQGQPGQEPMLTFDTAFPENTPEGEPDEEEPAEEEPAAPAEDTEKPKPKSRTRTSKK